MSGVGLPDVEKWRASAACRPDLFAPLEAGARIGLALREPPEDLLLWEAGAGGVTARTIPFAGYDQPGVDVLLSADEDALSAIHQALEQEAPAATPGADGPRRSHGDLFAVLRHHIREGSLLCFMMRRRGELEALGYEELLEALGFACLGGCR